MNTITSEKYYNALMHSVHWDLKYANELFLREASERANFFSDKLCSVSPYDSDYSMSSCLKKDIEMVCDRLYPNMEIARIEFPQFSMIFYWIESQHKPKPVSCWCIGCKNIRSNIISDLPEHNKDINTGRLGNNFIFPTPVELTFVFQEMEKHRERC